MNEPDIILRQATAEDTAFAREAHRAAFHEVVERQFGSWDDEMQAGFFKTAWDHPGFQIILYRNQPCGYFRQENLANATKIQEIVLLPSFQGKGIGSIILKQVQAQARLKSLPVQLQVLKANNAYKLYERLGFKNTGSTDTHNLMEWRPEDSGN
jgi:ribosomal protein S18 acetylase RimI-like enzyme